MKNFILIFAGFVLVNSGLFAQNIECIGNPINISMTDYKFGNIQWQFSANGQDWVDLAGKTSTNLSYNIIETGYFRAKVTYGDCDYFADSMRIEAYPAPTIANAGADLTILTEDISTELNGNPPLAGNGKWNVVSGTGGSFVDDTDPKTTFTGSSCSDYVLRWTISTECKVNSDDVIIGFHAEPTTANAGPDQSIISSDTVVSLSANTPTIGVGKWSIVSGGSGSFANDTTPSTIFSGFQCTDYVLRWTISTECGESTDEVSVDFHSEPTVALAGGDISIIDSVADLSANTPINGKGRWSVVSGVGGTFENDTLPSTKFIGQNTFDYMLRWTISTKCKEYSDDMVFTSLGGLPVAATLQSSSLQTDAATISGMVNPNYYSASIFFEYGTTLSYGNVIQPTQNIFDGSSDSQPTVTIGGLLAGTSYHFRIVAENSMGKSYGEDLTFTTLSPIQDIEGNIYKIVSIGTQIWMGENLKTSKYNDGTNLPLVIDPSEWASSASPAFCWYGNDKSVYGTVYGALYNWFSVNSNTNGGRNLCPAGWHISTDDDWTIMENFLIANEYNYDGTTQGNNIAKSLASQSIWMQTTVPGAIGNEDFPEKRNVTGFNALPGGLNQEGGHSNMPAYGYWWSSTEALSTLAWSRVLGYEYRHLGRESYKKTWGFSARCVKDEGIGLPGINTDSVKLITTISAVCGGNITSDGNSEITQKGICWSSEPNPTLADSVIVVGSGTGNFEEGLTGLAPYTTNYVRAFATNSIGTGYGLEKTFKTYCGSISGDFNSGFYAEPTLANAGDNQMIVNSDSITILNGNPPSFGTGKWSIISGTGGSFTNDTISTTSFKANQCSDYVLRWTISNACKISYDDVLLGFHAEPTTASAGSDQFLKTGDTSLILSANSPVVGLGKWTILSGNGGLFADPSNPNSLFFGILRESYELKWSINSCVVTSDRLNVYFGKDSPSEPISDADSNIYNTVWIGTQCWMAENLKTSKYNDNSEIPLIGTGGLTTPGYYSNSGNKATYGVFYNWYAVNSGKLCPTGWHVPSDAEWTVLSDYLGGEAIAGGKLKEAGLVHWLDPNAGATNETGFTALPGGFCFEGSFGGIGYSGYWWSSTGYSTNYAMDRNMYHNNSQISGIGSDKKSGWSVRCIKD